MPTRLIHATVTMACCRDGQQVYNPYPRDIIATQTKKQFDEPIELWKKRAKEVMENKYNKIAEDECSTMGTLTLCKFDLVIIKAIESKTPLTETGIERISKGKPLSISTVKSAQITLNIPTPKIVYQQLDLIRERMSKADSIDEYLILRNEMDKLKERYRIS